MRSSRCCSIWNLLEECGLIQFEAVSRVRLVRIFAMLALLVLPLLGCSTLPEATDKPASLFKPAPLDAPLVREGSRLTRKHPGETGLQTLFSAKDAFLTRRRLIREAESSLDLQYYIWELDQTGTLLAHELIEAAKRGVRVRLLLDDIHSNGAEFGFELLDRHPNIEVRLFNPFADRTFKLLDFLVDGDRVNHRMHNKLMIADSILALMGGRNIGDDYFGVHDESNFRDLDLLLVGKVVKPLMRSFDSFWNSRWSLPIERLNGKTGDDELARQTEAMREHLDDLREFPYLALKPGDKPEKDRQPWHWGTAKLYLNEPEEQSDRVDSEIKQQVRRLMINAEEELLIETAYFVPLEDDILLLSQLVQKGVSVKILTNSLATTDVAASHAGYGDSRSRLLRAGVQLFELRPDALDEREQLEPIAGSSQAALHSKIMVIDRARVVQGSFNLDPRSLNINTEIGLIIESPSLTAEILDFVSSGMAMKNSYRLQLQDGALVWVAITDGRRVTYAAEPEVGWWQRFLTWTLSWLPIKHQL